MRLMIRSLNAKLTETVYETIERQLNHALSRFESSIDSIRLTMRDRNGPRGGIDQECRVHVHLNDGTHVTVSEVQANLLAAVARLADRVSVAVTRTLKRRREFVRVRVV